MPSVYILINSMRIGVGDGIGDGIGDDDGDGDGDGDGYGDSDGYRPAIFSCYSGVAVNWLAVFCDALVS